MLSHRARCHWTFYRLGPLKQKGGRTSHTTTIQTPGIVGFITLPLGPGRRSPMLGPRLKKGGCCRWGSLLWGFHCSLCPPNLVLLSWKFVSPATSSSVSSPPKDTVLVAIRTTHHSFSKKPLRTVDRQAIHCLPPKTCTHKQTRIHTLSLSLSLSLSCCIFSHDIFL